ncbi:glycosyltransferase family 4 protein [Catellatospora coxensis]
MGVERREGGRGRVVMLVDNAVNGDSRVQKTARSAAEAGWDTTLLGLSPDHEAREWMIGGARVRLLPGSARARGAAGGLRRRWQELPPSVRRVRRPADWVITRYWMQRMGDRAWRKLEPGLIGFDNKFGPVIDELQPDIIHAHDFRMIGVGARAAARARHHGRDVKLIWDAHEYLPGVRPWRDNYRWQPAHLAYEREYARYADKVITVSDELARMLQHDHKLAELPAVVLNAPDMSAGGEPPEVSLRERCGIGPDVPLLVYSGAAAPARGLGVMVEALPTLPGVHMAMVINSPSGEYATGLIARAAELGVADRLHVTDYVPAAQVANFLAGATAGVIPIRHFVNHEISLITKFFEYSHARLPIIASDVRTMAATIRGSGQGEVFRADDVADFVRAAQQVLADPERYRAAYDKPGLLDSWTWAAQAEVLDDVYSSLLPVAPR